MYHISYTISYPIIIYYQLTTDFGPQFAQNGYHTAAQAHTVEGAGNGDDGGGGGGGGILAAICAAFCKDNPLGESLGLNQTANGGGQASEAVPITSQSKTSLFYTKIKR